MIFLTSNVHFNKRKSEKIHENWQMQILNVWCILLFLFGLSCFEIENKALC